MSLVTHALDDLPTVAILGQARGLLFRLKTTLEKNQLGVVVVEKPSGVEQTLNAQDVYKIIVALDLESTLEPSEWLKILRKRPEPVLVLLPGFSIVTDKQQADKLRQVTELLASVPKHWSVVMGLDVISKDWSGEWLKELEQGIQKRTISSSPETANWQTLATFTEHLSRYLVSPWRGERLILAGTARPLSQIHQALAKSLQVTHHFDVRVTKSDQALESVDIDSLFRGELQSNPQDLDDLIKSISQQLEESYNLAGGPALHKPTPPAVAKTDTEPSEVKPSRASKAEPPATVIPDTKEVSIPFHQPPMIVPVGQPSDLALKQLANKETPTTTRLAKPSVRMEPQQATSAPTEKDTQVLGLEPKPGFPAEQDLQKTLENIFTEARVDHKVKRIKKISQKTVTISKKNARKNKFFWVGMAFMGVAVGIIGLAGVLWGSVTWLERELVAVAAASQVEVGTPHYSSSRLNAASQVVSTQLDVYQSFIDSEWFAYPQNLVEISNYAQQAADAITAVDTLTHQAISTFAAGETGQVVSLTQEAAAQSTTVYQALAKLESALQQLDSQRLSSAQHQQLESFLDSLQEKRKSLASFQQLQPLIPELIGIQGKRTYVVLLQNNQELRPTGGFIQAVAFVTVDQGAIIDTQVMSVYELEKSLAVEVEPPADLKKYLGEERLFLHDANWNPDFPSSAERITWFLERVQNRSVDGVISLNLLAVEDIIQATRPLEMSAFNEVITNKNLAERAEFHSEVQLVDTTTQPDYSAELLRQLLLNLTQLDGDQPGQLASAIRHNFDQEHIQIYARNSGLQASLTSLGWAGEIITPDCPPQLVGAIQTQSCQVDAIYQVESNVGVNKANYYVTRDTQHQVSLSENRAEHVRTVVWNNAATSNSWPRGTYKSYVRFYLPISAELEELKVDGKLVSPSEIIEDTYNNRKILGTLVEVPIQKQAKLELRYQTSLQETTQDRAYAFFDQKQPGIELQPTTVTINHGPQMTPKLIAPQAEVRGDSIVFNSDKQEHFFAGVVLAQ